MSLSIDQLLEHMSWANQGVYKAISQLPDEALGAFSAESEWTVGEILHHTAAISGILGYRISGVKKEALARPTNMQDLQMLTSRLLESDQLLIDLAQAPDAEISITQQGKSQTWLRSTIISQAIHHATEHRAQAVCALEVKGYSGVNLDDFHLWAYHASGA